MNQFVYIFSLIKYMSNKLSQHDPFYTGPLWGQNGTYVKPDELYWLGGESSVLSSGDFTVGFASIVDSITDLELTMINLAGELSANDLVKEDLDIFTFESAISALPFSFDTTYAKTIVVENKDATFHLIMDGIGIPPEQRVEIDADFDYLTDKTYQIDAVYPTAVGSSFSYENAPLVPLNVLSASDACVRVIAIANNVVVTP